MEIQIGIASTTHKDKDGMKFSKEALLGMAYQINQTYIPMLLEHSFEDIIGVNLYGEVFELPDGNFALGVVQGIFQESDHIGLYLKGTKNKLWKESSYYLNINELINIFINNQNIKFEKIFQSGKSNLSEMLEKYMNSTSIAPNGIVYYTKHYIGTTGDLRIEIYSNDHLPPHFHVTSKQKKINARFDLYTYKHIDNKYGKISEKDKKKIESFFLQFPALGEKMKAFYNSKDLDSIIL